MLLAEFGQRQASNQTAAVQLRAVIDTEILRGSLRPGDRFGTSIAIVQSMKVSSEDSLRYPASGSNHAVAGVLAAGIPGAGAAGVGGLLTSPEAPRGRGYGAGGIVIVSFSIDSRNCSMLPLLPVQARASRLVSGSDSGKSGYPSSLTQDGAAIGAAIALVDDQLIDAGRTNIGNDGCSRSLMAAGDDVFGCPGPFVLAVGAPGLFDGNGAVLLTTIAVRWDKHAQPGQTPSSSFVIASYAVIEGPRPSTGEGQLAPPSVWFPYGSRVSGSSPRGARTPLEFPSWGDELVLGFGSQIVVHGSEVPVEPSKGMPTGDAVAVTGAGSSNVTVSRQRKDVIRGKRVLLAVGAMHHSLPDNPPGHCSVTGGGQDADSTAVWPEDPTMCVSINREDTRGSSWDACHHGDFAGVLAAPRTLMGARFMAARATPEIGVALKVELGVVSAGDNSPYRRVDDGSIQAEGGMPGDAPPVGPASWMRSNQKVNGDREYFVAQDHNEDRLRLNDLALIDWRQANAAEDRLGFCLRPIHGTAESAAGAITPVLSLGSVGLGGLYRKAIDTLRLMSGSSKPQAVGGFPSPMDTGASLFSSSGIVHGFAPLADAGHPDEGMAWRVYQLKARSSGGSAGSAISGSNGTGRLWLHPPALGVGSPGQRPRPTYQRAKDAGEKQWLESMEPRCRHVERELWSTWSMGVTAGGLLLNGSISAWKDIANPCLGPATGILLANGSMGEGAWSPQLAEATAVAPWSIPVPIAVSTTNGTEGPPLVQAVAYPEVSIATPPVSMSGLRYYGAAHAGGSVPIYQQILPSQTDGISDAFNSNRTIAGGPCLGYGGGSDPPLQHLDGVPGCIPDIQPALRELNGPREIKAIETANRTRERGGARVTPGSGSLPWSCSYRGIEAALMLPRHDAHGLIHASAQQKLARDAIGSDCSHALLLPAETAPMSMQIARSDVQSMLARLNGAWEGRNESSLIASAELGINATVGGATSSATDNDAQPLG